MGYTHYWYYNPSKFTGDKKSTFSKAAAKIAEYRTLLESRGLVVCGPTGTGAAEITPEMIAYNGDVSSAQDHESFHVERDNQAPRNGFAFCKTARKPYDTLVCLSLMSLFEAFRDPSVFSYCSDGDEEEWLEACEIYKEVNSKAPPTFEEVAPPEQ